MPPGSHATQVCHTLQGADARLVQPKRMTDMGLMSEFEVHQREQDEHKPSRYFELAQQDIVGYK